jgi:hypothetical protein
MQVTREDAEDVVGLLEESLLDAFTTSHGVVYGLAGTGRGGPGSRKHGPTKQVCCKEDFNVCSQPARVLMIAFSWTHSFDTWWPH